ncbi:MAG: creatininase family protein [Candidatus Latescibacterota bacterium]
MSEQDNRTRRDVLRTGLASITGATLYAGSAVTVRGAEKKNGKEERVMYAELLPSDFRKRLAEKPLAYLPLGTLEWHGGHLPIGSDAIQAESLMVECARRYGGIVLPPVHIGPGPTRLMDDGRLLIGMDFWGDAVIPPRQLDGDCYWISEGIFASMIDGIITQCKRTGFKAVFADGHGPSRASWVRDIKSREDFFGLKFFGVTPDIQNAWKSQTDHAALNETSLMLNYRPDLVDLSKLSKNRADKPLGVWGEDPRDATAAHGLECMNSAIEIMIRKFREAGV